MELKISYIRESFIISDVTRGTTIPNTCKSHWNAAKIKGEGRVEQAK